MPIFLLDVALIVLKRGATSREGDVFGFTIAHEEVVDELGSIIGI